MTRTLRWAWVALFLLLAVAAIVTNVNSRRILVLHEGTADRADTHAFNRGLTAILGQASRLKLRHQYLGFDLDVCHRVLEQLQAFDPDAVIAEGLRARQCLDSATPSAQRFTVSMDGTPSLPIDQSHHVAAWARLLSDIAQPGSLLLVLHGVDQEGLLEYRLLADAAQVAGVRVQSLAQEAALAPQALTDAAQGMAPDLLFVGRTLDWARQDAQDNPQADLLRALRLSMPQPILASRLESLALGADMVLVQAPEQRGELLAQAALALGAPAASQPHAYEMAVGLRSDFVARQGDALPSFYVLSARLAGFLSAR